MTLQKYSRRLRTGALMMIALMAIAGCGRSPVVVDGTYRAVLALPGGDLPFTMVFATKNGRPSATIVNGAENVEITEIETHGDTAILRIPGYENRIEMTPAADGYRGDAVMVRPGGSTVKLPFVATRGQAWRFSPVSGDATIDVSGRWALSVMDTDGSTSPAIAELNQSGTRVTGTILDPTGDHRFLEGEIHGSQLLLSRFDGGSAFLYHATINQDGTLSGTWWSGAWAVMQLAGHRDEKATLVDPAASQTVGDIKFSFRDLSGTTVSLADERFHGKVVILAIGGSWCPNCHDEAAFLTPLYAERHAAGLEVIALQFEHFSEPAEAVAANQRFVKKYAITWPVLIAGISKRDDAASKLPGLGEIYAFPTTLVIDRHGKVRRVHAGFSGPATGAHYTEFKTEFTALIDQLLHEPA